MAEYEAPYMEAERLRINGGTAEDFWLAIGYYRQYILLGGPNGRAARHMTGVCYQRLHEYDKATECYLIAMEGAPDYERGSIERDMAESYGALGEYELAEVSLATSLGLLPYDQYPAEHAASLGFLARLQLRQGQIAEAVETFADADQKLHAGPNRYTELYNKLHYASALSRSGRGFRARRVAFDCLKLSFAQDPATERRYGSRQHHQRALALLIGGHRLEDYLKAGRNKAEEELAAELGLKQTRRMKVTRWIVLRLAPRLSAKPSSLFIKVLSYYQKLGEQVVDAKPGPGDYFRISAQIGLMLLSASIRRDIARFNASYADYWAEDLNDALTYASNVPSLGLQFDLVEAIERLIAAGPASRNN